MLNKLKKYSKDNIYCCDSGFGLVDAIVSLSLLFGVLTYGIYFSSLRLNTVYQTNLTRSINKEIQRDIEKLKSELWSMDFDEETSQYDWCQGDFEKCIATCESSGNKILENENGSWYLEGNNESDNIQSWTPSGERSKVFQGEPVLISRELNLKSPLSDPSLNQSISSISYRIQWGNKNIHWVSIYLTPEAHSWCKQII